MKNTILIISLIFFCCTLVAQDYNYQETKPIEIYSYPKYKGIYKKAKKLLELHLKEINCEDASEELINVMAFRINKALAYMNLAVFQNHKNYYEVHIRITAIEDACIKHGIYINPRLVNIQYNRLYGETSYAIHYKGKRKPNNWSAKKSRQIKTLKNTTITKGYSSIKYDALANTK